MNENKMKYYSTGEFAKLCNINKKTLFYYDEVGLLKPEIVLENGYRYYSVRQIEVFDVIDIMRKLKISLKEIKHFLDNRTPKNTLDLFDEKKKMIEAEIKSLEKMYEVLQVKTDIINSGLNASNEVFLEEQPAENLILSNKIRVTSDFYDVNACTDLINRCNSEGLHSGYPVGVMISKEKLQAENFLDHDYFFIKTNHKEGMTVEKPKGLYVCAYHNGYYDTTPETYKKIMKFIAENNLEIDCYSYEENRIDEIATSNTDEFIIKISVKCKK